MRNTFLLRAAIVAGLATLSVGAFAADTQSLTVSANVTGVCKFTSTATTLAFNALDPSNSTVPTAPTATITYKCTKGVAAGTFKVGTSLATSYSGVMTGQTVTSETLPFQITWPAISTATLNGFGPLTAGGSVTLTGVVLYADYANLSAQSFQATVALEVSN